MSAVLIVIIVIIVLAGLAFGYRAARSKRALRESFGPEYDQLVQERGSSREADRELVRRKHEHAKLELRPISEQDREGFLESWEHLQASFIDDPVFSMNSAEQLVSSALEARGYPGGDREEQLALLSVEYSGKLTDYRSAQDVKRRVESGRGTGTDTGADTGATATDAAVDSTTTAVTTRTPATTGTTAAPATTEDIRQALLSYRALFDELVAAPDAAQTRPGAAETETVPAREWSGRRDESIEQKVEQ